MLKRDLQTRQLIPKKFKEKCLIFHCPKEAKREMLDMIKQCGRLAQTAESVTDSLENLCSCSCWLPDQLNMSAVCSLYVV